MKIAYKIIFARSACSILLFKAHWIVYFCNAFSNKTFSIFEAFLPFCATVVRWISEILVELNDSVNANYTCQSKSQMVWTCVPKPKWIQRKSFLYEIKNSNILDKRKKYLDISKSLISKFTNPISFMIVFHYQFVCQDYCNLLA